MISKPTKRMREGSYDFANRVAFVTGGATGIGRETALAFARSGAAVLVADTNVDSGLQTAHLIQESGGRAAFVQCDVSNEADVKRAIQEAVDRFGGIDYAFNNAGVEGKAGSTSECTSENWDRVLGINLKGVWLCMKHQIPLMVAQGEGSIVNCSSIAGLVGFPGLPAYVASKHGVIGLTRTAALENAKAGVRVNAVCPGVIQTPMVDRFTAGSAEARAQLEAGEPVGRIGDPREVAQAVLWLSSGGASFVTGHALAVDGGWVAQ